MAQSILDKVAKVYNYDTNARMHVVEANFESILIHTFLAILEHYLKLQGLKSIEGNVEPLLEICLRKATSKFF